LTVRTLPQEASPLEGYVCGEGSDVRCRKSNVRRLDCGAVAAWRAHNLLKNNDHSYRAAQPRNRKDLTKT
jgi:hypothetical protein